MTGADDHYPKTIRAKAWARALGAAFFFALAGLLGFVMVQSAIRPDPAPPFVFVFLGAIAVGLLAAAYHIAFAKVVLEADSIAGDGLFGHRQLQRGQIEGFRVTAQGRKVRIVPNDPTLKPITFSAELLKQEPLSHWMDTLVYLDARDSDAIAEALEQDARYGATVEERHAAFGRAIAAARVAGFVAFITGAWLFLQRDPYWFVLAAGLALPPLAVALNYWSGDFILLSQSRASDPRPSVQWALIIVSFALTVRAAIDLHMLDWPRALEWSLLALVVITPLLVWTVPSLRGRWTGIAGIAFVVPLYVYGALAFADVRLDTSKAQRFQSIVMNRDSRSTRYGMVYELDILPWGPAKSTSTVRVGEDFYHGIARGNVVCLYLRPGFLGLRWYDIGRC
jgi:hypothetical protein